MGWEVVIPMLFRLGASWAAVRAVQQDAGLDEAQIAKNKAHWDVLFDDVKRAAEGR